MLPGILYVLSERARLPKRVAVLRLNMLLEFPEVLHDLLLRDDANLLRPVVLQSRPSVLR
jgi:hypothetical protein